MIMFILRSLLALVCVLASTIVTASCGSDDDPVDTATSTSVDTDSTTTRAPEPTATEPPATTASTAPEPTVDSTTTTETPTEVEEVVNLYWGGTVVNATGTPERLLAGGRIVTTSSPPVAAIEALFEGPNELESEIGMFTSIPEGVELLGLELGTGVAVIDLSAEFEESDGSLAEFIRLGQVVFTLTQFEQIDAVTFEIDGEPKVTIGSHGIDVSTPVDRGDFESIRALVLPERPYPGASFQSGDSILGESNTFEASVQWVITDGDGLIIGEGFTTATDGNGNWGRFDIRGILDAETAGRGALIVFDISAEDGSQINIVEYPIELVGA